MSSLRKIDVVTPLLGEKRGQMPVKYCASAFAPSNIALCKYWGKRNEELNLPITPSLSISLGKLGTTTSVCLSPEPRDIVTLNNREMPATTKFAKALATFLDLFRPSPTVFFRVDTQNTVPTAAGMASSASGFAALVLALDDLFGWALSTKNLSILARLGSGSACRSVLRGFVEWNAGADEDGLDSYAEQVKGTWPDLRLGVLRLSELEKEISSRQAMKCTRLTSSLYEAWPIKVSHDIALIKESIETRDFELLGRTAESNALAMHATGLAAWPPVLFWLPESVATMRKIWALRKEGLPLYFTMDAGPNIKMLFTADQLDAITTEFPAVEIVEPFSS
ncbi:MAG: diphosphomevalonate decarboxylase [Verrucomicrobia bacterium]|nr:diphosphomevalonate decarboxylase [Kiritimatiellia bacterium]MCO6401153.1 diphosphomevalonate decarboxylase [Verrucomicrobiota bacterium]